MVPHLADTKAVHFILRGPCQEGCDKFPNPPAMSAGSCLPGEAADSEARGTPVSSPLDLCQCGPNVEQVAHSSLDQPARLYFQKSSFQICGWGIIGPQGVVNNKQQSCYHLWSKIGRGEGESLLEHGE